MVLIPKRHTTIKLCTLTTIISPSRSLIKDIQGRVWKFIFGKSCIHQSRTIALLPKKCSGIDALDVAREVQTYAAHLYYQAIIEQDTPWCNFLLSNLNTFTRPASNIPAMAFLP